MVLEMGLQSRNDPYRPMGSQLVYSFLLSSRYQLYGGCDEDQLFLMRESSNRRKLSTIENRLKMHQKVRMLYQLGREFSGFTAAAMWDDAKLGIRDLSALEKIV